MDLLPMGSVEFVNLDISSSERVKFMLKVGAMSELVLKGK